MFEPLNNHNNHVFATFSGDEDGVLFQGVGAYIDPANKFAFPILRAEASSFSMSRKDTSEISELSGEQLVLVGGY